VSIAVEISDWPSAVIPYRQMLRAAGSNVRSGFTLATVQQSHPEIGGRAVLEAEFSNFGGDVDSTMISGLISEVYAGRVFRMPVTRSAQTVSAIELGATESIDIDGLPWSNDEPWSNDQNWAFNPVAEITADALEGSVSLTVDLTPYGRVLSFGKWIGIGAEIDGAPNMVRRVQYNGLIATLSMSLPLRADFEAGDLIRFKPTMLGTVQNPEEFAGMFEAGEIIKPGRVRLLEALL